MQKPNNTVDSIERDSIELARAFIGGDRRAFDHLIRLHKRLVFNVCYRFLGDYDEADDCAQEVCIKVFRSLGRFRFESRFTTWLYRIAVNTCKNRLNSRDHRMRAKMERFVTAASSDDTAGITDVPDTARTPDTELARQEIGRLIHLAVQELPLKQKIVVVLRDYEGKSYEEIASITGFTLGTVKSTLSRARLQLRELLKGTI